MALPKSEVGETGSNSSQSEAFAAALDSRKRLVYDYIESWAGAVDFKPREMRDAIFSYVRHRGKGLRPALLLFCCGAAGGSEEQAVPAAAAVEIFHIWTLVHDDIIDRDDTRRGAATVHAQFARYARETLGLTTMEASHYGTAVGILAGDLQQSWSYALLADIAARGITPAVTLSLIQRMASSLTPQLLEGELLDVQFAIAPPDKLSESDIVNMLGKKSAALLEFAAQAGVTIGLNGRKDSLSLGYKLGRFAFLCGTAFQMHDDMLGLTANEVTLGKPVGSDIREGKRTLVVYRALSMLDAKSRAIVLDALGKSDAAPEQLHEVVALITESGALSEVRQLANSYISQALELVESLPPTEYISLLRSWALFLLSRKY